MQLTDNELKRLTPSSAIQESNRRLTHALIRIGGIGVLLPFLLPESRVLADTMPFRLLEQLVPSATKAAAVATYPNVVLVYFSLMFTLAPLVAVVTLLRHERWRERCRPEVQGAHSVLRKAGRSLLATVVLVSLNLFIYLLPATASTSIGTSRGQLLFSFALTTKLGLALVGGLLSAGVFAIWWASILSLGLALFISFNPDIRSDSK
jgi:hypothetical protein